MKLATVYHFPLVPWHC